MSSKVVTEAVHELKSDMSGQTATHTATFTYDGITASIDLTDKEFGKLDETFRKYITKASDVSVNPNTLRAWGAENGFEVGTRGRLHGSINEAYLAALRGEGPSDETQAKVIESLDAEVAENAAAE